MAPCYAVLRRATPCRAPQLCFASLKKENETAALCSKHRGVYWSKKVRCAQPKILDSRYAIPLRVRLANKKEGGAVPLGASKGGLRSSARAAKLCTGG